MSPRLRPWLGCAVLGLGLLPVQGAAQAPVPIPVRLLASPPSVDGNLAEWSEKAWTRIKIGRAVAADERGKYGLDAEDRNNTGDIVAELQAGTAGGQIFVAVRWPDDVADSESRGYEWLGNRYVEGRKRDDMLALRFHMAGDFDRSMLSAKTYAVDLWLWAAGRTNPAGVAEDWVHQVSTRAIEGAAEYEVAGIGTVYVKKIRDAGQSPYKQLPRPKEKTAERLPSFEINANPSGSVADVRARGRWSGGKWQLEFARRLDTGHDDDVVFRAGAKVLGQVAIWNRASEENKSVSEPLLFDFSALK